MAAPGWSSQCGRRLRSTCRSAAADSTSVCRRPMVLRETVAPAEHECNCDGDHQDDRRPLANRSYDFIPQDTNEVLGLGVITGLAPKFLADGLYHCLRHEHACQGFR